MNRRALFFVAPNVVLLLLAFALPLVAILSVSVYDNGFTLKNYQLIATNPAYARVVVTSLQIALLATVVTMALAYPLAYYLTRVGPLARGLILAAVIIPFWTNVLARTYAWIVFLQMRGLVNWLVYETWHLVPEPLSLVYNRIGVTIGMVHYLLPPAILILFNVNKGIDRNLMQAAQGLGAKPGRAFLHVFLPLSMPGLGASSMLITILGFGFFVTPALLGNREDLTLAMLINNEFTEALNWGLGSALATLLMVLTFVSLGLYYFVLARINRRGMVA